MKVQMQGQRLRLRVDEAGLARLLAGEVLENLTRLPGGIDCRQQVRVIDGDAPLVQAVEGGWCFELPGRDLDAYIARLPCREGLAFRLPLPDANEIQIDFEVDVRDSVRSRGVRRKENLKDC